MEERAGWDKTDQVPNRRRTQITRHKEPAGVGFGTIGRSLIPDDSTGERAIIKRHGFDLMLGNPPYIRIQTLKKDSPELAEFYKQRYHSASKGNFDLYVCFVE